MQRLSSVTSLLVLVLVACGGDPKAVGDAGLDGVDLDATVDAPVDAFVVPAPPTVTNASVRLEVGEALDGVLAATDANGDVLTYSIVTPPTKGQITAFDPATGAFTYTAGLVKGSDLFTFQVSDGTAMAAAPGTVNVVVEPVLFTGVWNLTGVTDNTTTACSNSSFKAGHAPTYFDLTTRPISCGSTTYTFNPGQFAVNGTSVTDTTLSFSQSRFVSGCGTVTNTFQLARTATGFTYRETAVTPCFGIGTHVINATATRTLIAYLALAPASVAYGRVYQNDPASRTMTLANVGRIPATAITYAPVAAPFGMVTSTCGAQLAGLSSCTFTTDLATTTLGDGFSGAVSASYMDGIGTSSVSSTLSGSVIPKLVNATAISAGYGFQCAIANGVVCWGSTSSGQGVVPPLVGPTAISSGFSHACALDSTGVHCWGGNTSGQATVPALVSPTKVSAGRDHTCAIDASGVRCWGDNTYGQITVPAMTNPVAISAGDWFTCAIDDTGAHCWGRNQVGQTTVPVLVNPTSISAGSSHACALDASGAHCWGNNSSGRATVPALINPRAISAGGSHTCALHANGTVCWGFPLGTTPQSGATFSLSSGSSHACAISGTFAYCWGGPIYP